MRIALMPGDGIGPEVVAEARRVLDALGLDLSYEVGLVGGAAYKARDIHCRPKLLTSPDAPMPFSSVRSVIPNATRLNGTCGQSRRSLGSARS